MNVVPILDRNAADIPNALRKMADDIEAGVHGEVDTIITVLDCGSGVELFGWGLVDGLRCIGLLNLGAVKFSRMTLDHLEHDAEFGETP
jgi:hypothetical protein